jgi:hypothetical protein
MHIGTSQDNHAYQVYNLHVADISIADFSRGMPIYIGMTRLFFNFLKSPEHS